MVVKLDEKKIEDSWQEFFAEYKKRVEKVPIHIRALFVNALKHAFEGGFVYGFDEYRKKQRGKKNGK